MDLVDLARLCVMVGALLAYLSLAARHRRSDGRYRGVHRVPAYAARHRRPERPPERPDDTVVFASFRS